jgi:hypothetical protein
MGILVKVDKCDVIDFEVVITDTGWSRKKHTRLCLVDTRFESLPGHCLSHLRYFVFFLSPSRKMLG